VHGVAFSPDGTCIVSGGWDQTVKVWYARTGQESILMPPDAEELAYRRVHTQPNLGRYREGYEAARAAQDDFAARFYLNLLPPPEQKIMKAQAAADHDIAAGRTPDALVHLVMVSAAKADDTSLALRVAYLQAWFGQDKELEDSCGRALEAAKGTFDPKKWDHLARICCLRPTPDKKRQEDALALARKAEVLGGGDFSLALTFGMAKYRSGSFVEADATLRVAAKGAENFNNPQVAGTAIFYRAMALFRQGKESEARRLATEAAARMKPLPKDDKNPLAGGASLDDLMLWLAYKEAKGLIQFEAAPANSGGK